MAAFMPGASPPLVKTAILFIPPPAPASRATLLEAGRPARPAALDTFGRFRNAPAMRASEPQTEPTRSLSEVHSSVEIPSQLSFWRRLFAFAGPAYLVSVGYMDPGNWATDIAAGSQFGYGLLWVLVMANLMAVLLQTLSARLGVVTGKDLAQACRDYYPRLL